jgi:crotonobetainyl-CoA:carnitine CoA-transferase CaiB-like acyl-CoA transferase
VGTRTLASHGADVLRVDGPRLPEDPAALLDTGPGKRHSTLDLADPAQRAAFEELLARADVLVQGYRPGALAAHGLDPDRLAERYPGLVVVTLSAWGAAGPWAFRRGFDSIVQAASGIAALTADADGSPGVLPAQALDHGTGHLLAATVARALTESRRQGGTWHGELSLAQLAAWLLRAPRPAQAAPSTATDPTPYLVDLPSPSGVVTLVRPPGSPVWSRGPVPAGHDLPTWRVR